MRSNLISKDMIAKQYSCVAVRFRGGRYQDYLSDGYSIAEKLYKSLSVKDLRLSLDGFSEKHLEPLFIDELSQG